MKKTIVSTGIIVSFIFYSILRGKSSVDILPATTPGTTFPVSTSSNQSSSSFKDGEYTGISADAYYGYIQVKAVIAKGKLTDVIFLQYPNSHGTSIEINKMAMPYLKQEAIAAQNENVDIVSGATDTSKAFIESLSSALMKAKS